MSTPLTGVHASTVRAMHGRLPWLAPQDLTPEQRGVYDDITGGPRASGAGRALGLTDADGRLHGPFNAMLVSPALGDAVQRLGAAVRYRTALTDRAREIAILEVARAERSDFEWFAHERIGARVGLTADELRALQHGEAASTFDATEHAVHALVASLTRSGDVDDSAYAAATATLGATAVVELVTLVGYYRLLALAMRVHRTPLPDGAAPPVWPAPPPA